jgi:hypothetical protein
MGFDLLGYGLFLRILQDGTDGKSFIRPYHTIYDNILGQWLQWLQLGVTFSQVVWLIGC